MTMLQTGFGKKNAALRESPGHRGPTVSGWAVRKRTTDAPADAAARHARSAPAHTSAVREWAAAFGWCALMCSVLLAGPAYAALDGPTIWEKVKELLFGQWGLILGFLICAIAIGGVPKWGIGWACGLVGAAVAFFMIPGVLTVLQDAAKGLSK